MKAWTKGLLVFGLILLTGLSVSGAPVPSLINYQGRLTDSSGMPISGSVSMRFSIWDASEFGLELWSENQTVSVNNGIYNVLLGSMNPLSESVFGGPGRYLEVEAGGETLSPRQQIVSVPFAFKAGEAGIDPNDLDTILAVEQAYGTALGNFDLDGDGEDRLSRGGSDCDDTDPSVYPGATDICEDGIDQDCNGFDLLCATFDVVVNSVADTDNYGGGGLIGLGPTITLRDAINACNDEPGIQTILFDPIIAGQSIFITSQLPFFNEGVYIDGDINDDEEFNPANDITLDLSALVGASVGFYVWTSNFTLEYMGFSGFSFALGNVAVYVSPPAGQGISNIWVSNCQFSGTVQVPLMVSGVEVGLTPGTVDNVWFEDNKFIGVNGSGITISGGLNSGNVLNNINIIGNEINGGQNFGIAVLGGNPDTSNNIINGLNITENTCENLTGVGIGIMVIGNIGTGGGHQINNANISNNVLRNNNFFGLDVSLGSTAANNTVSVTGAGNEITGNTFFGVRTTRNNDMAGTLSVDLGGGGVSGGLNTISGNGVYGFYTDGTDYMYAENNYWGAPNGPADGDTTETDGITDPTGSGDLITGYVYWGPHVQGQWVEAAAPSPGLATVAGRADDICAPVSGEVYVAAGRFVLEYDGGWSAPDIQVDPELEFVSVSSPSSGVVWAIAENEDDWGWGNEPELYSLQGGTWEDEDLFVPMGSARVHDIYMTSATHGWVAGGYCNGPCRGQVFVYDGDTWNEEAIPALPQYSFWWELDDIHGIDASQALACGEGQGGNTTSGIMLYYNGSVWSEMALPNLGSSEWYLEDVVSIQAGSTTKSWSVGMDDDGESGLMLYAENYSGWTVQALPPQAGGWELGGIDVLDNTLGFAVGAQFYGGTIDAVLLQWDGATWTDVTPAPLSSQWALFSVDIVSATEAWAGGIDLVNQQTVVLRYNGATWTPEPMPSAEQWYGLEGVSSPATGTGWAVGRNYDTKQGVILELSGGTWSLVAPPLTNMYWTLNDVSFPTTTFGAAVGYSHLMDEAGLVLLYNTGTWSADTSLPDLGDNEWSLESVSFPSGTRGWAVGEQEGDTFNEHGLIMSYNSGTWNIDALPAFSNNWYLEDVHFNSTSDGWAVGYDQNNNKGVVLHYNGANWLDATPGSTATGVELLAVNFISPTRGWAGGVSRFNCQAVVLSYDTGVWSSNTLSSLAPCNDLEDMSAIAADRAWVVGEAVWMDDEDEAISWYYNGSYLGVKMFNMESWNKLTGIDMLSETEGWAVGLKLDNWETAPRAKGLILQYQ